MANEKEKRLFQWAKLFLFLFFSFLLRFPPREASYFFFSDYY